MTMIALRQMEQCALTLVSPVTVSGATPYNYSSIMVRQITDPLQRTVTVDYNLTTGDPCGTDHPCDRISYTRNDATASTTRAWTSAAIVV